MLRPPAHRCRTVLPHIWCNHPRPLRAPSHRDGAEPFSSCQHSAAKRRVLAGPVPTRTADGSTERRAGPRAGHVDGSRRAPRPRITARRGSPRLQRHRSKRNHRPAPKHTKPACHHLPPLTALGGEHWAPWPARTLAPAIPAVAFPDAVWCRPDHCSNAPQLDGLPMQNGGRDASDIRPPHVCCIPLAATPGNPEAPEPPSVKPSTVVDGGQSRQHPGRCSCCDACR